MAAIGRIEAIQAQLDQLDVAEAVPEGVLTASRERRGAESGASAGEPAASVEEPAASVGASAASVGEPSASVDEPDVLMGELSASQ